MAASKNRRTQAERTAASDRAMFKAAIKLIAREGPNNMTLASLGKEAGFSAGLVNYRFGSKSKLLQAAADKILELWSERVIQPARAHEGGLANLKLIAKLYIDAVVARSDLMLAQYRLMNESYTSYKELQPAFRKYDRRIRDAVVTGLKSSQETGEIDPTIDLDAFAVIFVGMLRGIAVQYFIDRKAFDSDTVYNTIAQTCDRLLAKR